MDSTNDTLSAQSYVLPSNLSLYLNGNSDYWSDIRDNSAKLNQVHTSIPDFDFTNTKYWQWWPEQKCYITYGTKVLTDSTGDQIFVTASSDSDISPGSTSRPPAQTNVTITGNTGTHRVLTLGTALVAASAATAILAVAGLCAVMGMGIQIAAGGLGIFAVEEGMAEVIMLGCWAGLCTPFGIGCIIVAVVMVCAIVAIFLLFHNKSLAVSIDSQYTGDLEYIGTSTHNLGSTNGDTPFTKFIARQNGDGFLSCTYSYTGESVASDKGIKWCASFKTQQGNMDLMFEKANTGTTSYTHIGTSGDPKNGMDHPGKVVVEEYRKNGGKDTFTWKGWISGVFVNICVNEPSRNWNYCIKIAFSDNEN